MGRPFKVVAILNETADKLASKDSKDNKFKQLFDVAGTLVRLESGETGVVSSRANKDGALTVHVLRGKDGAPFALAERRITNAPGCAIAEALDEDSARLRFTMQHIWGELAAL